MIEAEEEEELDSITQAEEATIIVLVAEMEEAEEAEDTHKTAATTAEEVVTLETPLEGVWVGERVTEETEEETVIKEEGKMEEGKVHSMTVAGGMGVTHKGMVGEAGRETGDTMTQEGVWVEGWVEGVEDMMEAGVEDQHMEIEAPAAGCWCTPESCLMSEPTARKLQDSRSSGNFARSWSCSMKWIVRASYQMWWFAVN